MKSKLFLLATVAGLSLCAASQSNAHNQGWYVGLEVGANWIDDTNFGTNFGYQEEVRQDFFVSPLSLDGINEATFDTGWAAFGTVGYGFDNNWRVELELGFRKNDVDLFFDGKNEYPQSFAVNLPQYRGRGDLTEFTAMFNVLYDVPLAERLDLNLGLGVGVDFANFDDHNFVDDTDTNFAFQAIAGLTYAVTPRLDLTLTYRFLHVNEPEFRDAAPYYEHDHYRFDDFQKHSVTVGLRYDLYEDEPCCAVTQASAPPPPPPVEANQFVVFFGFNKCSITPEANNVLTDAAATFKGQGEARVSIQGHTDTMGSPAFNQRLSECRANAAASNLVSKGVPKEAIATVGMGETQLLVKTGDNVKEPQNRRATIDISGPAMTN